MFISKKHQQHACLHFGTLLLVRIPLVYGAEAEDIEIDHGIHSIVYGVEADHAEADHSHMSPPGDPPYQATGDTFEWLKRVVLITQPLQHNEERDFHLSTPCPGSPNDILVQKALGAWATAIKQQMVWESEATLIAEESIVCSPQEAVEVLGPVIVWKAVNPWRDAEMTDQLIIRHVNNTDTYEWIEVSQANPKHSLSCDKHLELRPVHLVSFMARWTPMSAHHAEEESLFVSSTIQITGIFTFNDVRRKWETLKPKYFVAAFMRNFFHPKRGIAYFG